ncbi:MAG TPA: DEAD/DEAH box helicase [Rhodospirillaceae bacterium]|nr:DEAD/DEAH box helicase [Rhodospirillaceae bacterium]
MTSFTVGDLRRAVSSRSFDRGKRYHAQGRARVTRISPDGSHVEGEVRGGNPLPYQVSAGIRRLGTGRLAIGGECSCPVGFDCKHVAALLLQVLEGGPVMAPAPATPSSPPTHLTPEVANWLAKMERAAESASEDYPDDIRQRLIYLLDVAPDWQGVPRPLLGTASVRLLVTGEFSDKVSRLDPGAIVDLPSPAKYLRPSDHLILRGLARQPAHRAGSGRTLTGETGAELLDKALATGRCRWQAIDGPLLTRAASRPGSIAWTLTADGRQRPCVLPEAGGVALPMAPPWYVDPADGLCGPVDIGLDGRLLETLLTAPPVAAREVAEVRTRLAARLPDAAPFLPPQPRPPRCIEAPPVPHLHLFPRRLAPVSHWGYSRSGTPPLDLPLARLTFLYQHLDLPGPQTGPVTTLVEDGTVIEVTRHPQIERAARRRIEKLGMHPAGAHLTGWTVPAENHDDLTFTSGFSAKADDDSWLSFLIDEIPALREEGWRIDIADDFPFRLATADGEPEAELREGKGIDWFDLHLGVPVAGQRVDILPALLNLLRGLPTQAMEQFFEDDGDDDSTLRLRLEDGRILPLPFARLRPILKALTGLFATGWTEGPAGFSRADAVELAAFAETTAASGLIWRGGEKLRALGEKLKDAAGIPPVTVPPLFVGSLRPYQQTGVAWMQLLREVELGGVLADDMGLGKTVQTLAHLAIEKAEGRADRPTLIVAPTSVLPNWRAEAAAFTPGLAVLPLHGLARKESFAKIAAADIVLTTYPLLARDIEVLAAQPWHMVVIDEAQAVKNPATAGAQALRRLEARHRLALTGTPLENHLGELWALFDFVSPGFLGDARSFARTWRTPIEKKGDGGRQAALARRVRPFLLRRTKTVVAAELPPKTEITEHIDLSQVQRDLYEGIRLAMHKKVREAIASKGLKRSRIEFLDALLKLRQACCDPRLVKTARSTHKAASAKLVRLMEMLPELIGEGRRILLFSQFTSMLALIEAELTAASMPYLLLTGDTTDRATPVRRFQSRQVPLFLISLKAGGTGINLTAADTVIHYDPWWNPAVEAQATDRAHRIGQDKPVFVYRLVADDTIEVKMAELKARKQALADGLFGAGDGTALDIGEDDIEFLLGG